MGLPKSIAELERIRNECRTMVTKRASASGVAAVIPVPGIDIGADISIMMELLPAINRKFGLSPEQIDELDSQSKKLILVVIKSLGSKLVGEVIGKEVVILLLKKYTARIAVKQVAKFVPFIGPAVSLSISFTSMDYIGNSHIDECYVVAKRYLEDSNQ